MLCGGVGAGDAIVVMSYWAGRERIVAEIELAVEDGVAGVSSVHVLSGEGNRDVKVQIEAKDGAGNEDNENGECSVLVIGDLDFHGTELDAPARIFIVRRRFEAHMLPVGRLEVLEMIGLVQIEFLEVLGEYYNRVTDEEVGEVRSEEFVHSAIQQALL